MINLFVYNLEPTCVSDELFMYSCNPVLICWLFDVLNAIHLVFHIFFFISLFAFPNNFSMLWSDKYSRKYLPQMRLYCHLRLCKYHSHTVSTVADPQLTLGVRHIQYLMFLKCNFLFLPIVSCWTSYVGISWLITSNAFVRSQNMEYGLFLGTVIAFARSLNRCNIGWIVECFFVEIHIGCLYGMFLLFRNDMILLYTIFDIAGKRLMGL